MTRAPHAADFVDIRRRATSPTASRRARSARSRSGSRCRRRARPSRSARPRTQAGIRAAARRSPARGRSRRARRACSRTCRVLCSREAEKRVRVQGQADPVDLRAEARPRRAAEQQEPRPAPAPALIVNGTRPPLRRRSSRGPRAAASADRCAPCTNGYNVTGRMPSFTRTRHSDIRGLIAGGDAETVGAVAVVDDSARARAAGAARCS